MKPVGARARLARGGLLLAGLASPLASLSAQAPTSERELIDRVRQIQGELGAPPPAGAREQELIERVQALRREATSASQSEARAATRPELGEDEVQALLREGLGVEILKIEVIESDGRPAYSVTVMNPPGNDNRAFVVETLVVDGATGGLLGRVPQSPRTAASGPAQPSSRAAPEASGLDIRRRSLR